MFYLDSLNSASFKGASVPGISQPSLPCHSLSVSSNEVFGMCHDRPPPAVCREHSNLFWTKVKVAGSALMKPALTEVRPIMRPLWVWQNSTHRNYDVASGNEMAFHCHYCIAAQQLWSLKSSRWLSQEMLKSQTSGVTSRQITNEWFDLRKIPLLPGEALKSIPWSMYLISLLLTVHWWANQAKGINGAAVTLPCISSIFG